MFPNVLYRSNGNSGGCGSNEMRTALTPSTNFSEQQSEGIKVIKELQCFKTYLTRRLEEIHSRCFELYEQAGDIKFYLQVMNDTFSDSVYGVEGLKGFVSKIQEMQHKYPLSTPTPGDSDTEDEMLATSSGSEGEDHEHEIQEESEFWDDCIDYEEIVRNMGLSFQDWRIGDIVKSTNDEKKTSPKTLIKKIQPNTSVLELKKRIEKNWDGMFKLGCKKGKGEKVCEPEREPLSELQSPTPSCIEDIIDKKQSETQLCAKKVQLKTQQKKSAFQKESVMPILQPSRKERTRVPTEEEINFIPLRKTRIDARLIDTRPKRAKEAAENPEEAAQQLGEELINGFRCSNIDSETGSVIDNNDRESAVSAFSNTTGVQCQNQRSPASAPQYALRSRTRKSIEKQEQISTTTRQSSSRKRATARLTNNSSSKDDEKKVQTPPSTMIIENADKFSLKSGKEKQVETKNKKRRILKDVEKILPKKKKMHHRTEQKDIDLVELGRRIFTTRTNEMGGQIIGKGHMLVNTHIRKIDLGTEDKSGVSCVVKEEVKQEVGDMPQDDESEYLQNDPFITHLLSMVEDVDGEVNNAENTEHQKLSAISQNEDEEMQVEVVAEEEDSEWPAMVISSVQGNFVVPVAGKESSQS